MLRKTSFAFAAAAAFLLVAHAGATTIETTSFSAWQATLTGAPVEANFNQVAYTSYDTSAGITLSGVGSPTNQFTFTGPDNGSYILNGQNYSGLLSLVGAAGTGAGINVAFSGTGQDAFLISVGSTGGSALSIALSDGETYSLASGVYGFTLSHPITSIFLSAAPSSQVAINDYYYGYSSLTQDSGTGTTPVVAEGKTFLLVIGGGLTLFGMRRKLIPIAVIN